MGWCTSRCNIWDGASHVRRPHMIASSSARGSGIATPENDAKVRRSEGAEVDDISLRQSTAVTLRLRILTTDKVLGFEDLTASCCILRHDDVTLIVVACISDRVTGVTGRAACRATAERPGDDPTVIAAVGTEWCSARTLVQVSGFEQSPRALWRGVLGTPTGSEQKSQQLRESYCPMSYQSQGSRLLK